MSRIVAFDYLRFFAIFGIIVCHFCYNFSETIWLGKWSGDTFNALFLMMSALLLGLSWEHKGHPKYGWLFLKHRFGKLIKVYYPFLIVMFLFLYMAGVHFGVKDMLMHLAFLPWFDKLSGFGHLWFMTMISICYVAIFAISRLKVSRGKWLIYTVLVVLPLFLQYYLDKKGLPGYMFVFLLMFVLFFIHANDLIQFVQRYKWVNIAFFVIVVCSLYWYNTGNWQEHSSIAKWIGIASSVSIFGLAINTFQRVKKNRIVEFVAGISFEIYLVHHVFAYGGYSVMKISPNWFCGFFILIIISIVLGWCLNKIGNIIFRNI